MLTEAMKAELTAFVNENREQGLITARTVGLSYMLKRRVEELHAMMDLIQPWSSPSIDTLRDVQRLNAEVTLLLIERGA